MGGGNIIGKNPRLERKILEGIVDDFIICPVRNMAENEDKIIKEYISELEARGRAVHYPPRDTNQNDAIGLNICTENKNAIKKAGRVHIYYNPESTGTAFDLGMTFMARKPLVAINNEFNYDKNDKILGFVVNYAEKIDFLYNFYESMLKRRKEIKKSRLIEYEWKENSREFLFDFGMAFMAEKPIFLKNLEEVRKQKTENKSFQNVLLAVHDSLLKMPFDEFEKKYGIKGERNDLGDYISCVG